MMAKVVYLLCAFTSALCAVLLLRGYRRSRARLLYWSSAAFIGLALNNVLLYVDVEIVTWIDLSIIREVVALGSMLVLLTGLVTERTSP